MHFISGKIKNPNRSAATDEKVRILLFGFNQQKCCQPFSFPCSCTFYNLYSYTNDLPGAPTKREYTVICLRYGLKGGRCYAQREVACFLKISRSYISRIEKKAIEKLRAALKKEDFL